MKIGPLVADDRAAAESVLAALLGVAGRSEVFIGRSEPQRRRRGAGREPRARAVFETARMYKRPAPALRLDRIFGVTTFELG